MEYGGELHLTDNINMKRMVIIQTKGDKKHEKQHQNVQGSIRFLNI
jgi:hypothetical protein